MELTDGGVDMAFDAFGHATTTRSAFDATRKGGTCVVIGIAPEGSEAEIPMVEIVRNQKDDGWELLWFGLAARDVPDSDRLLSVWETGNRRIGIAKVLPRRDQRGVR